MFTLKENRSTWVVYIILMTLLSIVAFGRLSTHTFWDGWDDWDIMADTAAIAQDPTFIFSPQRTYDFRPPVDMVFVAGYLLWGESPAHFHLLKILLHLVAALLAAYTFRKLNADLELSLLGGLLFLLNTAHFRAIHWITCINYILALIFALCAIIAFTRYLETEKKKELIGAAMGIFLCVLSHPSSAAIVLFCGYLEYRQRKTFKGMFYPVGLLCVAAGVSGLVAYLGSPARALEAEAVLADPSIWRVPRNLLWYAGRLVSSSAWITQANSGNEVPVWELGVGILVLGGVYQLYRKKVFPAVMWGMWLVITILPFLNNRLDRLAFGPSRQLYFASVGFSFLLAWGIRAIVDKMSDHLSPSLKKIVYVCLIAGLSISSIISLRQAEALGIYFAARGYDFRSNDQPAYKETTLQLYERALSHAPNLVPSDIYLRMATAGFAVGKSYVPQLNAALKKHPADSRLNMLLGVSAFLQANPNEWALGEHRVQQALKNAKDANQLRRETAFAYHNLAVHFKQTNQLDRAAKLYTQTLTLRPDYPLALTSLANIRYIQNKPNEAIKLLQKTLSINPRYTPALQNLGNILFVHGHKEEATQLYQQAVKIQPNNADLHFKLGLALHVQGQFQQAIQSYQKTLMLDPQNTAARDKLNQLQKATP